MKSKDSLVGRIAGAGIPPVGAAYIRLVHRTSRWEWIGREVVDDVLATRRPIVAAFWHGRLAMMPPVMAESVMPLHVLISNNRDGELIARLVARFGGRTIRGSSRHPKKRRGKGGDTAARTAMERLAAGDLIGITPDGPRGPRMQAQEGVAALSAWTDTPVVPFAWASRRARALRSWDRFLVPLPFDRGIYVAGKPIHPAGRDEAAVEAHRLAVEAGLNAVTRLADERAGRVPVEPE